MTYFALTPLARRFFIPILTFALSLLAIGCSSDDGEAPTGPDAPTESLTYENVDRDTVHAETVDEGSFGNTEEDTLRVIRSQQEFSNFWKSLHGDDSQVPEEVDFSQKIVLAAVLGVRPTGGYEAKIESITKNTNPTGVGVFVTEIEPGPDCAVTQVQTIPYHIVKMDDPSTARILFQDNGTDTSDC